MTKKQWTDEDRLKAGVYKGYTISWLRKMEDHPDFHLVAEFDALEPKKAKKEEPKESKK